MILPLLTALTAIVQPIYAGLEARVPHAPQHVARSDGPRLSYELHLANYSSRSMRLVTIEVVDSDSGHTLVRYDGPAIASLIGGQWMAEGDADRTNIARGNRAVAFLDVPVSKFPTSITHRLTYALDAREPVTVALAPIAVAAMPKLELSAPLRGGPWAAAYAPEMEFGHRRYVYAIDGVARVPGRLAIDFFHAGETQRSERYGDDPGFGADVLAVADGTVTSVRDDVPDPERRSQTPVALADATGNFIALDLGDGRTAFYEHLRRGVRVKLGQHVRRGQIIGAVGATGQVGGTHLHLHLGNTRDPLRTEGATYRLVRFEHIGQFSNISDVGKRPWIRAAARTIEHALPAPNIVVRFAEQASSSDPGGGQTDSERKSPNRAVRSPDECDPDCMTRLNTSATTNRAIGLDLEQSEMSLALRGNFGAGAVKRAGPSSIGQRSFASVCPLRRSELPFSGILTQSYTRTDHNAATLARSAAVRANG